VSPARLIGVHGQWLPPADDPTAPVEDYRQTWNGWLRIVHKQRARKLRRRGEQVVRLGNDSMGRPLLVWFVERSS
jgi:2-succinyl-5-enolpyruvyl-6-hydroxy-3-cyclohexene-1-carboxylate synthase